ncbi:MAG: hypothetical protein Q4E47_01870 [Candidatus Saccharibacteria bacterium]|nr:hypothetical protein [Candidatus Saccharibacteria bacterium]
MTAKQPIKLSKYSLSEVYAKALRTYLSICADYERLTSLNPTDEERAIVMKEKSLSELILILSCPSGSNTEFARWTNDIRPCLLGKIEDSAKTAEFREFFRRKIEDMWAKHEHYTILEIYNAYKRERKSEIELDDELEKLIKELNLA